MNRREFIKGTISAALFTAIGLPSFAESGFDLALDFTKGPEPVARNIFAYHLPHFCHLNEDGFWLWAYFIDHSQGSPNDVGLARSKDGLNFEYYGKVLKKGDYFDDAQASFADVAIGPDSQLHMLYEGKRGSGDINSVCYATSRNGVDWVKRGPVIIPDNWEARREYGNLPTPGGIAKVDVGTPTLVWDSEWKVFYHTFNGNRVKVGYAHGPSLDNLQCSTTPLLDNTREVDSGTIGGRSNIINGLGYRYMAYEQCTYDKWGDTRFETCWWSSGLARAKDWAGPWEKMNGLLLPRQGNGPGGSLKGMGYEVTALLQQDDLVWMYYRTPGGNTNRIAVRAF